MKIGLYADPHFSSSSSIIVGRQGDFTGRLDNLIKSFTWMNQLFYERGCTATFCLGDLTDKPVLTAQELTAISRCGIQENNHFLIVGNHCRSDQSGTMNTLSVINPSRVYHEPQVIEIPKEDGTPFKILVLPYSSTPADLDNFAEVDVILSHNDLVGYDYGSHVSDTGCSIESVLRHCKLFVNGHLHNGGWVVQDRMLNLGQLSGMNFSSCGGEWEPSVGILDTETCTIEIVENPEAYRFKKVEFSTLSKLKAYLSNLPQHNYVLQVKVPEKIAQSARKVLDQHENVAVSRVLSIKDSKKVQTGVKVLEDIDTSNVYDKLKKFVKEKNPAKYNQSKIFEIINQIEKKEGAD